MNHLRNPWYDRDMPMSACHDPLSREIYEPVIDPLTGICYRNPCAAETAGVVDWLPGCVVADLTYPTVDGPVFDSWSADVWWSGGGRGGGGRRRRRHPSWVPGGGPGGGRFGAKLPGPRLGEPGPRRTVGGGGEKSSSPGPTTGRLSAGQRIGTSSVGPGRRLSAAPSYASAPTMTPTLSVQGGGGYRSAPTTSVTQRSTMSVASTPTARVRGSLKGLGDVNDTIRRLEAQEFVVQCDNWSQIPGVHGRKVRGATAAMREAKDVLSVGNNRTDVCRIYLPTNGWLVPGNEVVAIRRSGLGHKVEFNHGHKGLGQTTTLTTAVASVAQSWARIFVLATILGTVPPAIVGGVVRWKTGSWWKAIAAAGATVAVELAAAGAVRDRRRAIETTAASSS